MRGSRTAEAFFNASEVPSRSMGRHLERGGCLWRLPRLLAVSLSPRRWQKEAATDEERRVLVQELVREVRVFPDHLEVTVEGVPKLNVTLEEVGLKTSQLHSCGVGGASCTLSLRR